MHIGNLFTLLAFKITSLIKASFIFYLFFVYLFAATKYTLTTEFSLVLLLYLFL